MHQPHEMDRFQFANSLGLRLSAQLPNEPKAYQNVPKKPAMLQS